MKSRLAMAVVVCTMLVAVTVSTQAMTASDIQRHCETIAASVATQIGITADQDRQFNAAGKVLCDGVNQVWSSSISQDEKTAKTQALIDSSVSTGMSIVTSEQKTQGMAAVSMWLSMARGGAGINIAKSEAVGKMQRTGLTAAQADGILEVLGNHVKKVAAQPQDANLWPLRAQTCDEIKAKLTADQQKIFGALVKSAVTTYGRVKSQLTADQKNDLDALTALFFSVLEQKITIN